MRRTAIAAVAMAMTAGAWFAPGPLGSPLKRLVNAHADGPDPLWNVPVDAAALRRAHAIVPAGATYAVPLPRSEAQLRHDLIGGGYLFLSQAFPVQAARGADWLLIAGARTPPAAVGARRTIRLGPSLRLVER